MSKRMVSLVVLCSMFCFTAGLSLAQKEKSSWLKVEGEKLTDSKGKVFELKGVSYSLKEEDLEAVSSFVKKYTKIKTIRVVVSADTGKIDYRNSSTCPVQVKYPAEDYVDKVIYPVVKQIEKEGKYVVISLSGEKVGYEYLYGWFLPFWRKVAEKFKKDSNIVCYELWAKADFCPEDIGGLNPDEIKKNHVPGIRLWFMDTVKAIRRYDKRRVIMVEPGMKEIFSKINYKLDPGYSRVIFEPWAETQE